MLSIADWIAMVYIEMLTPIDQPLDKLEDLTPEEMSVFFSFPSPYQILITVWFAFCLK
jgi:hypothetical protein